MTSEYDSSLEYVNNLTPAEVKNWLAEALEGRKWLPKAAPDEPPDLAIERVEQNLKPHTREDLRKACHGLVRDFTEALTADSEYLQCLLGLVWWFNLRESARLLYSLALDEDRFSQLPLPHKQRVLQTLNAFKLTLPEGFWENFVQQDPQNLVGAAFSGLLLHGASPALHILRYAPDNQVLADSIACVLENHANRLEPPERDQLIRKVREVRPELDSNPSFRRVLDEWLEAFGREKPYSNELEDELERLQFPDNMRPCPRARLTPAA